ncbi:hypothetical protein QBC47DRAFT_392346 [Echria macrotheca]|uniref:Uncharacterized protein n=1 Tax=Echria macrotheca TaxID=438768 RepID=A0AAJ0B5G4_9PEZI|nr:hypothetical protein QBC47DRAFT_392346 [Echria macrotheca]
MAPNLVPNFEVKFLLKSSDVLTPANDLAPELTSLLSIPANAPAIPIVVLFLDTPEKTLTAAGWCPRIRRVGGKDGLELTYKKRYPIQGEDIDAALTTANHDGFKGKKGGDKDDDDKYLAQGEWGYEKMTLSISRDKKVNDAKVKGSKHGGEVGELSLPGVDVARQVMADEAPSKFDEDGEDKKKGWGKNLLEKARVYGPILTRRWVGQWQGVKMTVEVWPIVLKDGKGVETIVEASFKADTIDEARDKRKKVTDLFNAKGWLVPRDSLKTQLVMDNY